MDGGLRCRRRLSCVGRLVLFATDARGHRSHGFGSRSITARRAFAEDGAGVYGNLLEPTATELALDVLDRFGSPVTAGGQLCVTLCFRDNSVDFIAHSIDARAFAVFPLLERE